jgi:16S rRNA (adenine1518-N6/adenine1519-N6)-dimethyltransferase
MVEGMKIKKHLSYEKTSSYPVKKKALGQHFLTKQSVVYHMIAATTVTSQTTVVEIGCGEGFLTRSILNQTPCKQLIVYEIDSSWAALVKQNIKDPRLSITIVNVLQAQWNDLAAAKPLVMLANLPYQITFPIIFKIVEHKELFNEGVIMIQEEVAQKLVAKEGRSLSATGLFLQHHFDFKLMEKIEPGAFNPPPKVHSRLVHFKPKQSILTIPDEQEFWKFVKLCFKSPRQTLRNNLRQTHYALSHFTDETLQLRAQQLSFDDFLTIWHKIHQPR